MSNLTSIFGGEFRPPREQEPDPPEVQIRRKMEEAGITPPDQIHMDGEIHRFKPGTKARGKEDKSGWYVVYPDNIPAGKIGDFYSGVEVIFKCDVGRKLTTSEEMVIARRMTEARRAREVERDKQHQSTAESVRIIWEGAGEASPDHPYLLAKGIHPHGARITGDGRLIVPLYDEHGDLSSLQYIPSEPGAKKLYHSGGETRGKFWRIGSTEDPGVVYIAEGFATAATIHEVTGRPCFVAYSANKLPEVTEIVRRSFDNVTIVADKDQSGVGENYANEAAAKYGARVVLPPMEGDANDYHLSGGDLDALLQPKNDDWLIPADEFAEKPAPISWLIKHWVQDEALMMVHGPSGSGKTFVVLDMCLRIASGMDDWFGNRTKAGRVVYLAGEGHHGLRGRVAAWKTQHGNHSLDMWLSKAGCDLNTPQGYLRVSDALRGLKGSPDLVVVDTLHRFLLGDENSAQDAKTMLDSCNGLMEEFGCTVILVHHTGVNEESQHRARGSSAWKGALDIEISVVPPKGDGPLSIVQRKMKDAEEALPVYADLQSVTIPGWFDEDGDPVSSAVIMEGEAPEREKKDSKVEQHRKLFEQAWWSSGAEDRDGKPYLSRSAMLDYLRTERGLTESSAQAYTKPGRDGKPIADLLLGGVIEHHEHGWILLDQVHAASMMMRRNEQ